MNINTGDTVEFTARGAKQRGVVVRVRTKNRKKLAGLERRMGINSGMAHTLLVAEVTVGTMLWTVPTDLCKVVTKATAAEVQQARTQADKVKESIRSHNAQRRNSRFESARKNNLLDLHRGDAIQVNFRDVGWTDVAFVRYNTTGGIVFVRHGVERRANPAHVRRKDQPQPEVQVTQPENQVEESGSLIW